VAGGLTQRAAPRPEICTCATPLPSNEGERTASDVALATNSHSFHQWRAPVSASSALTQPHIRRWPGSAEFPEGPAPGWNTQRCPKASIPTWQSDVDPKPRNPGSRTPLFLSSGVNMTQEELREKEMSIARGWPPPNEELAESWRILGDVDHADVALRCRQGVSSR